MKGPVGAIVWHPGTKRIGVIVDPPREDGLQEGHSPVQSGSTEASKVEHIADAALELVQTSYEVSAEVLDDMPDYVKELVATAGRVYVRYGSEKYQLERMKNGELGIRRVE